MFTYQLNAIKQSIDALQHVSGTKLQYQINSLRGLLEDLKSIIKNTIPHSECYDRATDLRLQLESIIEHAEVSRFETLAFYPWPDTFWQTPQEEIPEDSYSSLNTELSF